MSKCVHCGAEHEEYVENGLLFFCCEQAFLDYVFCEQLEQEDKNDDEDLIRYAIAHGIIDT